MAAGSFLARHRRELGDVELAAGQAVVEQVEPPDGIDWVCVSPKGGSETVLLRGDEIKLVFPQPLAPPEHFAGAEFSRFYLQPMDGPDLARNTELALRYCLEHPQWRLSLQTHKLLGIP